MSKSVILFPVEKKSHVQTGNTWENYPILFNSTAMSKVTAELALLLDEGDLSTKERHQWLNVLKMTTYIACNLTESFENEYNKPSTDTLLLGKVRWGTNYLIIMTGNLVKVHWEIVTFVYSFVPLLLLVLWTTSILLLLFIVFCYDIDYHHLHHHPSKEERSQQGSPMTGQTGRRRGTACWSSCSLSCSTLCIACGSHPSWRRILSSKSGVSSKKNRLLWLLLLFYDVLRVACCLKLYI